MHTGVDRPAGERERPAGPSGTCPYPCVPFKDRETIGVQ